jgi:hypothetical protein
LSNKTVKVNNVPNVRIIDPLAYEGWDELVLSTEGGGIFYTSMWARVLRDSYGFTPLYLSSIEEGKIELLMPLMEVTSPITGKRAVSLPFTDRCETLFTERGRFDEAFETAKDLGKRRGWRYIEWRGGAGFAEDAPSSEVFFEHVVDLTRPPDAIFASFRESNRRNIKKAMKGGLTVSFEDSLKGLSRYYELHCLTRRDHGLPPQPFSFFRYSVNIVRNRY